MKKNELARLAGMIGNDPRFWDLVGVANAEEAATYIRTRCRILSRKELDTDPAAARRFHEEIRKPFAESNAHDEQQKGR